MAGAKNKVIAGAYEGKYVTSAGRDVSIVLGMFKKDINLNKDTVVNYEVMDNTSQKSFGSAVGRGIVGGVLLGPLGMLAGGLTAKSKDTYVVAVEFADGQKSLLEVNGKIYNHLMKVMF